MYAVRLVRVALVCAFVIASAVTGALATTTAGTRIANTVSATFRDAQGTNYQAASNALVVTVGAVSAVAVSPTQTTCTPGTDAVPVGSNATRTFVVTNDSNTTDAYQLTAAASGGSIVSLVATSGGAQTTVSNGATAPAIAPGTSQSVVVTFSTAGVAVGTSDHITLSARSTVVAGNGSAMATGNACAIPLGGTKLVGPTGLAIAKLVDGVEFEQRPPGASVTYTIDFTNVGGIAAHDARLTDPIAANVTAQPTSVTLNGAPVIGVTYANNTLSIPIGEIGVGAHDVIAFTAVTNQAMPIGGAFSNVATIAASNVPPQQTSVATVFVGVANVVYDGYNGASMPVASAVVTLVDDATGQPVPLQSGFRRRETFAATTQANTTQANATQGLIAAVTGAPGVYGLLLPDLTAPHAYDITIVAPGYLKRRIGVMLTQNRTADIYDGVLTAKDGQYLATPGGFALVRGPIHIDNVNDLLGNLPLFRPQAIALAKTVDRQTASAGDRLTYTITAGGVGVALTGVALVDTPPRGVVYVAGSGRANGVPIEPVRSGATLTWTFPRLTVPIVLTYAGAIGPGVTAQTTLVNTVTAIATTPNGLRTNLASANATTLVIGGTFSDRTVLTGRVYVDLHDRGGFERNDPGVGDVRIFLEDGESVVTDREGRYSFPGVRPGMHVLRLDVASLPSTVRAFPDRAYDAERSPLRLVHGIFDGGVMDDINFAVEPVQ